MWLKINPNDVMMFRGSRLFAAGQSFVARSSFPPHPQVMTGAIRTAVIRDSSTSFQDFGQRNISADLEGKIGLAPQRGTDAGSLGDLRLRGPFVCKISQTSNGETIERLFRVPQDVVFDKEQSLYVTLQPSQLAGDVIRTETDYDGWQPLIIPEQEALPDGGEYSFKGSSGWLPESTFSNYLESGYIDPDTVIPSEKVVMPESHVGLGIDYSRRAADEEKRLLYRAEFSRPYTSSEENYEIGLLVEANDGLLDSGYLSLGGESRFAAYEQVSYENLLTMPGNHHKRIKVVLLTPAYFSGGWQPTDGDWSPWMGDDAKLVSIAAGSPMVISGWDIVLGQPKPLYRYMPAGSVYYFENATPTGIPFTQSPTSLNAGQMGFGTVAYGTWNYLDESI